MRLRWCVALLSAVALSYGQDSTGIDAPGGPSAPKDSSLSTVLKPDSTAAKTDSNIANSAINSPRTISDSIKPTTTLNVSDGSDSPDKCGLQISCFPESASVFINPYQGDQTPYPVYSPSVSNNCAGLTPFKKWGYQEGYYEISIQKKGWEEFKQVVYLKMGQMTLLETHLTCKFGYLQVKSEPQGATVILNKIKKGVTPITLIDLKPGFYDLRLELAKFASAEMLVSIVKDSKTIVNKKLLTKYEIDSLHTSRLKNFQTFRRYFFAVTSLALASAGYYFNTKVDHLLDNERQQLNNYKNLGSGNSETTFETAYTRYIRAAEQTNLTMKNRNTLYKASALMAAGFIISIPF
jgi:hypothetical protein